MSETLKSSLSSVMDGEADEFEMRRVLDEIERDEDLRETWHRYHLIGSVMRGEPSPSPRLRAAIKTWLDGDEVRESSTPYMVASPDEAMDGKPGFPTRMIGAVAASALVVALAAFLAIQGASPAGSSVDDSAVQVAGAPSSAQSDPTVGASALGLPAAAVPVADEPTMADERADERAAVARRQQAAVQARVAEARRNLSNRRLVGRNTSGIYNASMDGRTTTSFTVQRSVLDQQRVRAYMLQHAQHSSIATRAPGMPFIKVITQKVEEPAR